MASEARDRLNAQARERDPEHLLGGRKRPFGWFSWTHTEKLDYIATRMILEARSTIRSHTELREHGVLSPDQYRRRLKREVYDVPGISDARSDGFVKEAGVFGRVYPIARRGGTESTGRLHLPGPNNGSSGGK